MADVEIRLGRSPSKLRPTFGAMREIEEGCRSSCATLLGLLAKHELHSPEMALIVYWGLVEAGEKPSDPEAVGNRLFEVGIGSDHIRTSIADYLAELLYAPDDARKKDVGEWFRESEAITSQMFSLVPMSDLDGSHPRPTDPPPEPSGRSSRPSAKNPSE